MREGQARGVEKISIKRWEKLAGGAFLPRRAVERVSHNGAAER
jgi:hypothetical protein